MLTIPMKIIMQLGEGRTQLGCMCGHEFTWAPKDGINTFGETATCPNCKAIWDRQVGEIDERAMRMRYYVLYGTFKSDDEVLSLLEDDNGRMLYIGRAVDMFHFTCRAVAAITANASPLTLKIVEIDRIKYESYREEIKKRELEEKALNSLLGFIFQPD